MKRNILLVDDDASLLATLGDFLASEGYEVSKAASGEQAMAMLRFQKPDLIVLDMSMPGMGGMGVLERLQLPDGSMRHPVLVLTARARMAEYFADKQVDGFIAKPCDPEDLSLEVSRIIFQRSAGAPLAAPEVPPVVFVGEPDSVLQTKIRGALQGDAYDVQTFVDGAQLVEAAILQPPAAIVMRLEMKGQSADVVVGLLRRMARTASIPLIVYGINAPDAKIEHVAGLDEGQCTILSTSDPAKLHASINRIFGL